MKEMIPLSLRQRKAFVWCARREYEDYAAIICDGAIRSGKTLAMGMGFFFWAMACFSDRQFALCGRSVGATCWKRCCRSCEGWALPARRSGAKSF